MSGFPRVYIGVEKMISTLSSLLRVWVIEIGSLLMWQFEAKDFFLQTPGSRVVMFASQEGLKRLVFSLNWYGDGTFRVVPR